MDILSSKLFIESGAGFKCLFIASYFLLSMVFRRSYCLESRNDLSLSAGRGIDLSRSLKSLQLFEISEAATRGILYKKEFLKTS